MAQAAVSHIAVCCRLPHGMVLSHPMDHKNRVTLNGANKATIIGAKYGTTMVPVEFWEQWHAVNKDSFAPLLNGAIFTAQSGDEAKNKALELASKKTGLEPLVPKEHGVKTVPKDDKDEGDGDDAAE